MRKIAAWFMFKIVGRLNWTGLKYFFTGREYNITTEQVETACNLLLEQRLVGLSYRATHFSSILIILGHFLLTGRWVKLCHAWINTDDEMKNPFGLKIYESISEGAIESPFWKVILCDGLVLLKPRWVKEENWDKINEVLKRQDGLPYDIFARYKDPSEINCCERVVRAILDVQPDALPALCHMMKRYGNLTPQMLLECGDFEVVYEV